MFGAGVRFGVRVMLLLAVCSGPLVAAEIAHLSIDGYKAGPKIDHNLFGQVTRDLPQRKPTVPTGGVQPSVKPGSETYSLDVSAAFGDVEQSIRIAIHCAKVAGAGKLWRMAPESIDAKVEVDKKPEVQVEEQALGALDDIITVRPFSVNIYSYPVQ